MRKRGSNSRWLLAPVALAVVAGALAVSAGSSSTTLSNGADLSVEITAPLTGDEFLVAAPATSLDVTVTGSASIGVGEPDATFVYVMDVSGSTAEEAGGDCDGDGDVDADDTRLRCEQEFLKDLNAALVASGESDQVGLVVFGTTARAGDLSSGPDFDVLVLPDGTDFETVIESAFSEFGGPGGLGQFTAFDVGGGTNCGDALVAAAGVLDDSTNGTNRVVMISDGICNTDGDLAAKIAQIGALAVVDTIAVGEGECDSTNPMPPPDEVTLGAIASGTMGTCFQQDLMMLPDLIPTLTGTVLQRVEIAVDGGTAVEIPAADLSLSLPADGAVTVQFETLVPGLEAGEHVICVTAFGSGAAAGEMPIEQCETIQVLALAAEPAAAVNPLLDQSEHTVTATLLGDASTVAGRLLEFAVAGQNAGVVGTCDPVDCTTDAAGQVSFTYAVPVAVSSAGVDTIAVTAALGSQTSTIELAKEWTLPESSEKCKVRYYGWLLAQNGDKVHTKGRAYSLVDSLGGGHKLRDRGPAEPLRFSSKQVDLLVCGEKEATLLGTGQLEDGEAVTYRIDLQEVRGLHKDRIRVQLSSGYDTGDQRLKGSVRIRSR